MGNEGKKTEIRPQQIFQSRYNSSEHNMSLKAQRNGLYQKKVRVMKPGPVMFMPQSVTGCELKTTEITDYSSYIKVKPPSQNITLKETRGPDYCQEVSSDQIDQNLLNYKNDYRAVRQRQFPLAVDYKNGMSKQLQMLALQYQNKLEHHHSKPQRTTQDDQNIK